MRLGAARSSHFGSEKRALSFWNSSQTYREIINLVSRAFSRVFRAKERRAIRERHPQPLKLVEASKPANEETKTTNLIITHFLVETRLELTVMQNGECSCGNKIVNTFGTCSWPL
jgi:hypothetical protein